MIDTIIFDLDGVLINSEVHYNNQIKEHLDALNVNYPKGFVESLVGICDPEAAVILDKYLPESVSGEQFIKNIYIENHDIKPFDFKSIMFDGVLETLTHFKSRGFKIGLASSSPSEDIENALTQMEIKAMFDSILCGHDFELSKPHPEIYLTTLKELGSKAENSVVIEDSTIGIEASKAANIYTIAKRDTLFNIDQSKADVLIDGLHEIVDIVDKLNEEKQ